MDTRAEDPVDEAPPPGWVLDTPTRHREVWKLPACAAVLAVLFALLGTQFGETLGSIVCTTCAVVVAAGAVALAVAGRTAYDEQTIAASWRLHVVRMIVGVTTTSIIAVGSLVVGFPLGWFFGAAAWLPMSFRLARSVPRTDRVIAAWASVSLAVACLTLSVVGFTVPDLPRRFSVTWTGPGAVLGALLLAMAVAQFALAERTPPDPLLTDRDGADA